MKTKTIITEITQEDLVTLFSTALYGSNIFYLDYPKKAYNVLDNKDEDDWVTLEDVIAKILFAGNHIYICDVYAEDESDFYGNLPHTYRGEAMRYKVTLEDIKKGLQTCFDSNEPYLRKFAEHLMDEDSMDLDQPEAEVLLQVIVFGEVIYG